MIRQILLPVLLAGALALVVLLVFILRLRGSGLSTWADVSLIALTMIASFLTLVPLLLLAGMIYGLNYVGRYLPGYARVAQDYFARAARFARQISERVSAPVIAAASVSAAARRALGQAHERDAKQ